MTWNQGGEGGGGGGAVTSVTAATPLTSSGGVTPNIDANYNVASGVLKLDGSAKAAIAQIPTGTSASTVAIGNDSRITGAEQTANKGAASGYAPLDAGSLVPSANSLVKSVAGKTGTVSLDHATDLANVGTNTHAAIDTFVASKHAASGLASLDASSRLVEPAVKIHETGGPTDLTVGVVADTQLIIRSGTAMVGTAATGAAVGLGNVTNDAQVKRSEMGAASGVATLDANSRVVQGASSRGGVFTSVTTTQTLGTSQPLSLTDATMTGLVAGGSTTGTGVTGVVAASYASSSAETGAGAGQAGLGANSPLTDAAYAGQRIPVRLNKANGDDVLVADILALPPSTDILSPVYGYLAFRSDLGANAKWRVWFYYRRQSDGVEIAVTPTVSVTNATVFVPAVYYDADLPIAADFNVDIIAGQRAAEIAPGSITGSQIAATTVTTSNATMAAPTVNVLSDASTTQAGTATTFLRSDARLLATTAAPSVTVKSENTAAGAGTSTSLLRADAQFQAATAAPSTSVTSDANASTQGSSNNLIRADARLIAATAAPTVTVKSENTAAGLGVSTSLMRADAQIQVATAAPATNVTSDANASTQGSSNSVLRADARLVATTASPTVTAKSENTAAGQGTSASLLRADAQIQVATAAPSTNVTSDANAATQGTSNSMVRADARHVATTAAPTAASIHSDHDTATQGSSASLIRADAIHTALTAAPTTLDGTSSNTQGTSNSLVRADHIHAMPASISVATTYTNPLTVGAPTASTHAATRLYVDNRRHFLGSGKEGTNNALTGTLADQVVEYVAATVTGGNLLSAAATARLVIYCQGTFAIATGQNVGLQTVGSAAAAGAGGAGGTSPATGGAGTAGGTVTNYTTTTSKTGGTAGSAGAVAGAGGNGGTGTGGSTNQGGAGGGSGGGGGAASTNVGAAGTQSVATGTSTRSALVAGMWPWQPEAVLVHATSLNSSNSGSGGAGGGGGGGANGGTGGTGGTGGLATGQIRASADTLDQQGTGAFQANGGNGNQGVVGNNGTSSSGGGGSGAGGGGAGGGTVVLIARVINGTSTANGGNGGAAQTSQSTGAGGGGAGGQGGAGGAGGAGVTLNVLI